MVMSRWVQVAAAVVSFLACGGFITQHRIIDDGESAPLAGTYNCSGKDLVVKEEATGIFSRRTTKYIGSGAFLGGIGNFTIRRVSDGFYAIQREQSFEEKRLSFINKISTIELRNPVFIINFISIRDNGVIFHTPWQSGDEVKKFATRFNLKLSQHMPTFGVVDGRLQDLQAFFFSMDRSRMIGRIDEVCVRISK